MFAARSGRSSSRVPRAFTPNKSKLYRAAKESVDTALKYAFVGRRRKKRDFRRLWVMRINAAARENGLTYGQMMAGLKAAGNPIDRKQLADLAVSSPAAFARLAKTAADARPATTKRPASGAAKAARPRRAPPPKRASERFRVRGSGFTVPTFTIHSSWLRTMNRDR